MTIEMIGSPVVYVFTHVFPSAFIFGMVVAPILLIFTIILSLFMPKI